MATILHLLRDVPDDVIADLIASLNMGSAVTVACLYPDTINATPVDWDRLVEDIFTYDRVICW